MRVIEVEKSFASKSVFVTGATGFLGKVLVEKLLRSCSDVEKVYILMRPKKGQTIEERFADFKSLFVFENIRIAVPCPLDKLFPIEGDLLVSPCADISYENLKLLMKSVSFVFHCAATVRFDEPLEHAIKMNLISTRNMLDLAGRLEQLEAFVHVSTAFSNINQKEIYERNYEPICDYSEVITAVEMEKKTKLDQLNEFAMKTFPNTYIFSKNLAEQLVAERSKLIPIAIVRPSIVCPSYEEPFPGWVDTINGPMGVLIGASSGLLRTVHGDGDVIPDLIPCDFVVNSIIVAGASVASCDNKELKIYNCTSSNQLPITWNQFLDLSRVVYKSFPSTKVVWFPGGRMCSNYLFYLVYFVLFQLIPSGFLDLGMLVLGKKPLFLKLQKRIFGSLKVFNSFLHSSWTWDDRNFHQLHKLVSLSER